jgi:hypothetical protein
MKQQALYLMIPLRDETGGKNYIMWLYLYDIEQSLGQKSILQKSLDNINWPRFFDGQTSRLLMYTLRSRNTSDFILKSFMALSFTFTKHSHDVSLVSKRALKTSFIKESLYISIA